MPEHKMRTVSRRQFEEEFRKKLGRSRWFTRGWTLQELITPKDLLLIASNWESIGRKSDDFAAEI